MKQKLLLKTMLLLCALVAGSSSVWGQVSTATATNGKSYVVAYYANSKYYALPHNTSASVLTGTEVTLNAINKVNTTTAASLSWTFTEGTTAGQFYLTYTSGSKTYYLFKNGTTSNTNYNIKAKETSDDKHYWEFTSTNSGSTYKVKSLKSDQGTCTAIYLGYTTVGKFGVYAEENAAGIILLEIGDAPDYTITAQSNNTDMGTVALSGTIITATPKDGYRVSKTDPYTVTSGTATVTDNSDNTFTVNPTSACTVQINFEAIPSHTLSYAVSPTEGGSVTLGETSIKEGATTTATATTNAGYKFTGWTITGTGATLSSATDNPTTVTMGTVDATVTATFEAVTTHAISWSVNGTIVQTDNVEDNTAITFPTSIDGIPTGYVLTGWSASTIDGTQATAPTYVSSATSTADITYYAVMAVQTGSGPDTYEKLESNTFDADATYVIGGKQSSSVETIWYLKSYANVDSNSDWGVATSSPSTDTPITFKLSGTATALVAKDNQGHYLTGLSTGKFKMSSTSQNVYLETNGAIRASSSGYYLRYNYNSGNGGFRWYNGSNVSNAYFYKVVPGATYSDYCTTVPIPTITITGAGWASFSNASEVAIPDGVTAYYAQQKDDSNVTLKEITGGYIPANTGVVVSGAAGTYNANVTATGATLEETNLLKPWLTAGTPTESKYYTLAVDGSSNPIFKVSSGGTLAAGKSYLVVSNTDAPTLAVDFGETTGINAVNGSGFMVNGSEVYNLNGQRVAQPTKGLYIVNGKKVIIK